MVLVRNNEYYSSYFFIYKDKIKNKCYNSKRNGVRKNDNTIC